MLQSEDMKKHWNTHNGRSTQYDCSHQADNSTGKLNSLTEKDLVEDLLVH